MNNGAWRFGRLLSWTFLNALLGSPLSAKAQGVDELVSYYQEAYEQGRDLVPGSQTAVDTSSISDWLALQTVIEQAALSGNACLNSDGTVVKLAEYARAEGATREVRAGIWATPPFAHPCGERYRANPSTN